MDTAQDGLVLGADGKMRCWWHGGLDDYQRYHDEEWGHPVGNDIRLFEKMSLEGFQAGLSWLTILRKRDAFRAAFEGFDFEKIARFGEDDVERCLNDKGIVRHRGKIEAVINNASRALELRDEFGSLAAFVWSFEPKVGERPAQLDFATARALATSPQSVAMSKALKKRGWKFVGPTTMYAFMQSMGVVNDHLEGCCCRQMIEDARSGFARPV
ncbi:DNA-3-methyladenine glycosylase I [Roseibium sp.]|uniref:DNA-3-methyladenine glycosylase I n=1 Tax=Roseibium sp. TaxID=1936156 RepID=UPI003A96C51D